MTSVEPHAGPPAAPTEHWLAGYLHITFGTSAEHLLLADVPRSWDLVMLSFAEPTTPESGCVVFAPAFEEPADLARAVAARQAQGQRVLLSVGGETEIRLTTETARQAFVTSISQIVDRYGLDGIDVNLEKWSLWLDPGDDDFRHPTTPVVINLIWALQRLRSHYGPSWVLTMAPETYFVQVGHQCYGTQSRHDSRAGVYLPVIEALREDVTVVHTQNYNSGPVLGLDGVDHYVGGPSFHVVMADMLLAGFPVGQDSAQLFQPLRPDQVALGFLSAPVDDGYLEPAAMAAAVESLRSGSACEGYTPRSGANPDLRGVMAWSITWDRSCGWSFMNSCDTVLSSGGRGRRRPR